MFFTVNPAPFKNNLFTYDAKMQFCVSFREIYIGFSNKNREAYEAMELLELGCKDPASRHFILTLDSLINS